MGHLSWGKRPFQESLFIWQTDCAACQLQAQLGLWLEFHFPFLWASPQRCLGLLTAWWLGLKRVEAEAAGSLRG